MAAVMITLTVAIGVLAVMGGQVQSPPRDARLTADTGVISGQVTGKDTGLPLPRMIVTLVMTDGSRRTETTDDQGRYEFAGLPPGLYELWAAPGPHRSTYLRQRFSEIAPASLFGPLRQPNIELKAGEAVYANIVLTRALAIEGRVLDPLEEPMAQVEVAVTHADGRPHLARPVYTDDLGHYRVYGLPPGRYRVCADAQERSDMPAAEGSRMVRTCHPASIVQAEADEVVLESQDVSGIDIRVQRAGTDSISGVVRDTDGAPVDGASVGAYPTDRFGVSSYTTSRHGEFTLKGLTPGRYVIYASSGLDRGDPNYGRRERGAAFAWAEVGAASVADLALALSKPASIKGTVTFEQSPAPRPDRLQMVVQTQPHDARGMQFLSQPPFSAVDDNRTFELKDVYRLPLLVTVQGLPDGWVTKSIRYEKRDITHVPTDFGSGPSGKLEIVVTNRVARPSIRVTDKDGTPLSSYHLLALPADPSQWAAGPSMRFGRPTPDGVLTLGAMLPGKYLLVALPPTEALMLMDDRSRVSGLAAIATPVTLKEGDATTVHLRLQTLPVER